MIPGGNILKTALSAIGKQQFIYYPYATRTLNAIGLYNAVYTNGVPVSGSVQPIPRSLYENMGLDFQRNYFNFFVTQDIFDVARDVSGDQFCFQGKNFQCVSKTAWYGIDGWDQVLCVEVPQIKGV